MRIFPFLVALSVLLPSAAYSSSRYLLSHPKEKHSFLHRKESVLPKRREVSIASRKNRKKKPNLHEVKKNYSFSQERKIEIIGRVNDCAIVRTSQGKVIVVKLDSGGER